MSRNRNPYLGGPDGPTERAKKRDELAVVGAGSVAIHASLSLGYGDTCDGMGARNGA